VNSPNDQGILYHYCDAHAALSIVAEGKVWLSSFALSNDSREGLVGREAIMATAMANGAVPYAADQIGEQMEVIDSLYGCYGMCFSTHHDKLSQWRGYADDGAGFAIGFQYDSLEWLKIPRALGVTPEVEKEEIRLYRVQYDREAHQNAVSTIHQSMQPHIAKLDHPINYLAALANKPDTTVVASQRGAREAIGETLLMSWPDLYTLKSEAFTEEAEWRAIALAFNYQSGFKFRTSRGKLVPYIEHRLPKSPEANPIREIVLGPRNTTPEYVVKMMLVEVGLSNEVQVIRSAASYRY